MILKKILVYVFVAVTALPKKNQELKSIQKLVEISNEQLNAPLTKHQDGGKSGLHLSYIVEMQNCYGLTKIFSGIGLKEI